MDTIITYNVNDLQTISIYDGTTFVSPASINDIQGVRLLFQTVNSTSDIQTATECVAWTQYLVTSGSAVANGVTYATGETMLFAEDTTPSGTYVMETTGIYSSYISDVLPNSGLGWTFTPSQVNRPAVDNIYFQDEIFTLTYEYYDTVYNAGTTLVDGTYLVVGTEGDTVVVEGSKTIMVGEIYTSLGSEDFTGTPTMVLFSESAQFSFATLYESFRVYQAYLAAKAVAIAPTPILDNNLLVVASLYASPSISADTTSGISLRQLQNNIDRILLYYAEQLNYV